MCVCVCWAGGGGGDGSILYLLNSRSGVALCGAPKEVQVKY